MPWGDAGKALLDVQSDKEFCATMATSIPKDASTSHCTKDM
jgi:hypothetical protein